jgi:hypothetical protein
MYFFLDGSRGGLIDPPYCIHRASIPDVGTELTQASPATTRPLPVVTAAT